MVHRDQLEAEAKDDEYFQGISGELEQVFSKATDALVTARPASVMDFLSQYFACGNPEAVPTTTASMPRRVHPEVSTPQLI